MKKLIPTVALALMGAAAVTGSTYAWFSMNKSVEATGMKVKATTDGALVIGAKVDDITKLDVNFTDESATVLSHSTHDNNTTDYPNGLKTITDDVDKVNPSTGVVEGTPTWRAANNNDTLNYYKDYEVFIAAAGSKMANKTIKMSMTDAMKVEVQNNWAKNNSAGTKGYFDTLFGFTVDVYAGGVVQAPESGDPSITYTFLSTYHLDDYSKEIDLNVSEIPSSYDGDTAQGLAFKFRVYLDGDYKKNSAAMKASTDSVALKGKAYFSNEGGVYTLLDTLKVNDPVPSNSYEVDALGTASDTHKYVRTEKASTSDLNLGFHFEAADKASA